MQVIYIINVLNLQRPGTADSVLSEPVSPRPHTSNTLVLPRYAKHCIVYSKILTFIISC